MYNIVCFSFWLSCVSTERFKNRPDIPNKTQIQGTSLGQIVKSINKVCDSVTSGDGSVYVWKEEGANSTMFPKYVSTAGCH